MLAYMENMHPEITREIDEKKVLTDDLTEKILKAVDEFSNKSR